MHVRVRVASADEAVQLRQELGKLGAIFLASDGSGSGSGAAPPAAAATAEAVVPPPAPAAAPADGTVTHDGRGLALELLLEPGVFRQASEVASQVCGKQSVMEVVQLSVQE